MTEIEKIKQWVEYVKECQTNKARKNNGILEWDCGYMTAVDEIERILSGQEPINRKD
jgi:hypothetical protein